MRYSASYYCRIISSAERAKNQSTLVEISFGFFQGCTQESCWGGGANPGFWRGQYQTEGKQTKCPPPPKATNKPNILKIRIILPTFPYLFPFPPLFTLTFYLPTDIWGGARASFRPLYTPLDLPLMHWLFTTRVRDQIWVKPGEKHPWRVLVYIRNIAGCSFKSTLFWLQNAAL